MGMDVVGKNPTSNEGQHFRRNVWVWHPLADICDEFGGAVAAKVESWCTNDGCGLDDADSKTLADMLDEARVIGRIALYVETRNRLLARMPDEPCSICGGTGKRREVPDIGPGDKPCNGCGATGSVRPFDTNFHVSVEDVQEFATFLRASGGFEIW